MHSVRGSTGLRETQMPGIVVHTLLGTAVLERWTVAPGEAPFPTAAAGARAAFLTGCAGPDMGMYPGGVPLFSDLAHYVRSGDLARALVAEARSPVERAFAWGWVSHLLADVLIHPLINLGAGDAAGGDALTFAQNPGLHVAVETAVDGFHFPRWRDLGLTRLAAPPVGEVEHVARAYRDVYGAAIDARAVASVFASWVSWHRISVAMAGSASRRLYGRPRGNGLAFRIAHRAGRTLTGVLGRPGLVYALTHPIRPSERVADLIARSLTDYPTHFHDLYAGGLPSLPNYNLDTGTVDEPATYPLTLAAQKRLAAKCVS